MVTLKIRRGLKANLPTSGSAGEMFFCTDTGEIFISNTGGAPTEINSYESNFSEKLYNAGKTASYNADNFVKTSDGGTYTPTLTAVTNVDSSSASTFFYQRMGNIVNVTGYIIVMNLSAGNVKIGIALPIASNLGSASDLRGIAREDSLYPVVNAPIIYADTTNDRAQLEYNLNDVAEINFNVMFTYKVI